MNIVTIGGATQDVFILHTGAETQNIATPEGLFEYIMLKEGSKIEVERIAYETGGGANNASFAFKTLGFDVTPFFKLGCDTQAAYVLNRLTSAGIPTDHIVQTDQYGTGVSFIIPAPSGDRIIFAYRGANAHITNQELPLSLLKTCDQLYITSLSGDSAHHLITIVQEAKRHNIPVANNPGGSQLTAGAHMLRKSLPYIDILILNASEAQLLLTSMAQNNNQLKQRLIKLKEASSNKLPTLLSHHRIGENVFSLQDFFTEALSLGPHTVVVTNGAEGVYVAHDAKIYFHPSIPVPVVNTLGSGDAFGSSFVGTLAAGKSLEEAIRHGVINAASTVEHMDAKTGLLTMDELERRAQTVDCNLLQAFRRS
ncbi:carbohydrate kinase family protein [Candidatus Babeliales bacterium]|nr:carbohydrate kinase family protein [Candidatus Babeliales bacterium]